MAQIEKRNSSRINAIFPITIGGIFLGSTIDISQNGALLDIPALVTTCGRVASMQIKLDDMRDIKMPFRIIWHKEFNATRILAGVQFLNAVGMNHGILDDVYKNFKDLDGEFISEVKKLRSLLNEIKASTNRIDQVTLDEVDQSKNLDVVKSIFFPILDEHFEKIWSTYIKQPVSLQSIHQKYCRLMLHELVEEVGINKHIYQKPFGYSGDFMTMEYIYTYHQGRYLGGSAFEKLLNHYTCNIPISKSNIGRLHFLEQEILRTLTIKQNPSLMSVGSGPLHEVFELLDSGLISAPANFTCIDFEPKTLEYIQNKLNRVDPAKRQLISLRHVIKNVLEIIRTKKASNELGSYDLIYASGVFDYLSDRLATALITKLYSMLGNGGRLIIINASLANNKVRAYYELVGEWVMYHRTPDSMLNWIRDESARANAYFKEIQESRSYLHLILDK